LRLKGTAAEFEAFIDKAINEITQSTFMKLGAAQHEVPTLYTSLQPLSKLLDKN